MSSLGEISVTIRAVNEATPQFEAVTSDAQRMASDIGGLRVQVPPVPAADTSAVQASFNEVSASAADMGAKVTASSASFTGMSTHAEATTVSLRTMAGGMRTTALMGSELTALAADFGLVDKETSKYIRTIMLTITLASTATKMYNFMTVATTGHAAAVAVEGTTETATAGATTASSIAHTVKTSIVWAATAAQNALNISQATFLALTGVGIGVIVAAAAAIAYFSSQMNQATQSVKSYNAAAADTPTRTRSIVRAQEQSLYRRGVE